MIDFQRGIIELKLAFHQHQHWGKVDAAAAANDVRRELLSLLRGLDQTWLMKLHQLHYQTWRFFDNRLDDNVMILI